MRDWGCAKVPRQGANPESRGPHSERVGQRAARWVPARPAPHRAHPALGAGPTVGVAERVIGHAPKACSEFAVGRDVTFLARAQRAAQLAKDGLAIESRFGNVRIGNPPTVLAESLREPFDLVLKLQGLRS